jgi:arylsulfatase A-like enzyme
LGRLWFIIFALAAASALPGAWGAWSAASAGRWSAFGDGLLFWLTWEGDPGGRRLLFALALAVLVLVYAALAQHSVRAWLSGPARLVHALCKPVPALAAVALALLPHLVTPLLKPDVTGRPSVVFILLDSVRLDHLGWGGSELPTSPRLDALAREGAIFTQAIAQAPWTKPSVATMFTGTTPSAHEATFPFSPLPWDRRTLAEAFASAGYRTFGYSSNPNVTRLFQLDQGFHKFHENTEDAADSLIEFARVQAAPSDPSKDPFFLYLHFNDAHYPYEPPVSSTIRGQTQPIRGLFNRTGLAPVLDGSTEGKFREEGGKFFSAADVEALRLAYAEEIRWLDDQVGDMVEKLLAERDDVLVVICADHGEEFLEHGDLGHGHSLHEELVRVPLQFAWSPQLGQKLGLKAGARADQVRLMDLTPTLLEFAGLTWPAAAPPLAGSSLMPVLRGGAVPAAPAFAETDYSGSPLSGTAGPLRMLREPGAKIVITDPWLEATAGRSWLYDLAADPGEHVNLAGQRPELLKTLRATLDRSGWLIKRDLMALIEVSLSPAQRRVLAAQGYAGDSARPDPLKTATFAPGAVPWVQDPR